MTAIMSFDNRQNDATSVADSWFDATPEHLQRRFSGSTQQQLMIHLKDGLQPESCVNFSSNDYLGLRFHPDVTTAAITAIGHWGLGSGSSRMVAADDPTFHLLEQELAAWKGYQSGLLVGSGMLANIGLIQALADRSTHIFADKLNHASLIDGMRLSTAHVHRYPHLDIDKLEALLIKHPAQRRMIVSDGVFSMDGDYCAIDRLIQLAERYQTLLLIDDAHGIGVMGTIDETCGARGLTENYGGHPQLIEVGTFGKAFGGYGAFILGSDRLMHGIRQRMRTMIYSTAMPLAMAAAMRESLKLIQQSDLSKQLHQNIRLFKSLTQGLPKMDSDSPIQPLMAGDENAALSYSRKLREMGFYVPAIRPPTVPKGTSRLRITLCANHEASHIHGLADALKQLTRETTA